MKIFYVGAFRFPFFDAASARVLNIGKALVKAGHSVEYIAMGGKELEDIKQEDGRCRYQGFDYQVTDELDCNGGLLNKIRAKISRGNKIIGILNNHDLTDTLVIAYNPHDSFLKKLIRLSAIKGFKLAVDLTEWSDNNELPIIDWYSYNHCMTRTIHKIHNKILISSYLDDYYRGTNNLVIPATCDSSDVKWQREASSIESYEGVTLIYAGNPAKKDLVHTVINVVNQLSTEGKSIRFMLLGISRDDYIERYGTLLESKQLSDNIIFFGKVSQTDVPAYYKHADYMILLREKNRKSNAGFPTKFAESMTAGIPVIANVTGDIGFYLKDGVNGYILDNESRESVSTLLDRICSHYDSNIIARMKENALQTGRECFGCNNYSDALNLFIKNLS